jgi:hypothetical protein
MARFQDRIKERLAVLREREPVPQVGEEVAKVLMG